MSAPTCFHRRGDCARACRALVAASSNAIFGWPRPRAWRFGGRKLGDPDIPIGLKGSGDVVNSEDLLEPDS